MINRKLAETPVKMMNRMEEITDLICEYNEEVQKQQQEIERLKEELKYTITIVEHNKTITKHLKEIERLNNKNEELLTLYTTEREVKEDYKSIINELEKWLEDKNKNALQDDNYWEVLEKLQKLKENI